MVSQLRERLKVDFTKLVEKQRLSVLTDGAFFPKYSSKGRVKGSVWYCRLSPNHKVIHYGEAQEGKPPAIESLPNKGTKSKYIFNII